MILQKINNQKGFTLVELMIAIAIIAILAAIAVPNFIAFRNRQNANSEPIIIQQEEKAVSEKTATPPKQKEVTEQKGEMNKL